MCYIVAHDKKQPAYEDDERSIGDRLVSKNTTTKALEALGANINFIDIWLKLSEDNYEIRYAMYNKTMKEMFKIIPLAMSKALSPKQKVQKLMTYIGGGCYMKRISKGLPPLRRSKISKNHKRRKMKLIKYEANRYWNYWKFQLHRNKL